VGNRQRVEGALPVDRFAFRYGGDEFVLLLPQTSKDNAMLVARRLHKMLREATWLPAKAEH